MSAPFRRVKVNENLKYKKSGIKSYVWLLAKYSITPTQKGPYYRSEPSPDKSTSAVQKIPHQRFLHGTKEPVGRLLKKPVAEEDVQGEPVTTRDVQPDTLYLSEVEIGTPPRKFWLDFDTGSSDLWVFSSEMRPSFPPNDGHNFFDTSKSSTFHKMNNAGFEIHFGDGSFAMGSVGTDNLILGGLTVENQALELADKVHESFISGEGDGLLGLGFGNINSVTPDQVDTPVENMIKQEDIKKGSELFTCKLGSWRDKLDEPDKGESFYTFGYIDEETVKACGEEIFYTPIDSSRGWWQFQSASATVNGKVVKRRHNTAIADTGTTLALIDDHTCQEIYAAIPGAKFDPINQGFVYPASTKEDKLPVVTLAVGDKQFVVQKEDLGFVGFKDNHGKEWMYGGIQSRGTMKIDILGDTFLKGIYAVFDQGNKRFGAVQRKELRQNLDVPE